MNTPSEPTGNGRDPVSGRFLNGHAFGKGNPNNARAQLLRNALLEAVSDADFRAIVKKLVTLAKKGEPWAVKELLDRLLGKPPQALELPGLDDALSVPALVGVVLNVLDPYPELKIELAAKLKALGG